MSPTTTMQVPFTCSLLLMAMIILSNCQKTSVDPADMLDLLQMEHMPRPHITNRRHAAPRYMLDLYSLLNPEKRVFGPGEDVRNKHSSADMYGDLHAAMADASLIMSFPNQVNRSGLYNQGYYFDTSDLSTEEKLISARLHLFKRVPPWRMPRKMYTLQVYRITDADQPDLFNRPENLYAQLTLTSHYRGWLVIEVTQIAQHWMNFPQHNLGLGVTLKDNTGRLVDGSVLGLVDPYGVDEEQAFIVAVFSKDKDTQHRKKRSTMNKKHNSINVAPLAINCNKLNQCCDDCTRDKCCDGCIKDDCHRQSFVVKFEELNWQDWVIAPDSYEAYFCAGCCRFPLHMHSNATNHAVVQTMVALYTKGVVPQTKCAPTSLSPISVLYIDDNSNVVLKRYQKMVADSCGCH